VTAPEADDRLAAALDRTAIVETVNRTVRCLDQLDWTGLTDRLLEELTVRYGYVFGDRRLELSAEEFARRWREVTGDLETTHHLLANHCVDVDGDEATCTAYCLVQHYYPEPSGSCTWTLGGHYEFGLRRTEDGWRIGLVVLSRLWATGNRHLLDRASAPDRADGRAGRGPGPRREG
jgi:hypothetical protein